MEPKRINVVWCDDAIDRLDNDDNRDAFIRHHCVLFRKAKTAIELKQILEKDKDYIDAVIVDFNMGENDPTPDKESASGFRWVHEHFKEYAPTPFYLYSAREKEFFENKYAAFEYSMDGDYFFSAKNNVSSKRNRCFNGDELKELLEMIEEEVNNISTPEFNIRQEFHKAFSAIDELGLDGDVFMKILLADESIDRYDLCNNANPLRMVIEGLISKLDADEIIPCSYVNKINEIPDLLSGEKMDSRLYSPEDRMPKSLAAAFKFFLDYTQDGSHEKNYLSIEFHKYLRDSKDIYIVKALAIICLDLIKWTYSFYEKYLPLHLCKFTPFIGRVSKLKTVNGHEGAIVYKDGKKYFVRQYSDEARKYRVGTNVEIPSVKPTTKEYGDYYCHEGKNLDL